MMLVTVIILVLIVQGFQELGGRLMRRSDKDYKKKIIIYLSYHNTGGI